MNIVDLNIDELIPYENNPRNNEKAIEKVAASIKEFGFKVPVVIDKNNVIVAGHTRYLASKQLGLTTVPCLVADDLTDEQVKAFRLADNKVSELAQWDFELLNKELAELEMDMTEFGFVNMGEIEWADVDDLTEEKYEEPKKEMLQCPKCNHVDTKTHFIKVG